MWNRRGFIFVTVVVVFFFGCTYFIKIPKRDYKTGTHHQYGLRRERYRYLAYLFMVSVVECCVLCALKWCTVSHFSHIYGMTEHLPFNLESARRPLFCIIPYNSWIAVCRLWMWLYIALRATHFMYLVCSEMRVPSPVIWYFIYSNNSI